MRSMTNQHPHGNREKRFCWWKDKEEERKKSCFREIWFLFYIFFCYRPFQNKKKLIFVWQSNTKYKGRVGAWLRRTQFARLWQTGGMLPRFPFFDCPSLVCSQLGNIMKMKRQQTTNNLERDGRRRRKKKSTLYLSIIDLRESGWKKNGTVTMSIQWWRVYIYIYYIHCVWARISIWPSVCIEWNVVCCCWTL